MACLGLTSQRWPHGFGSATSNKAFWWTGHKDSRSFISPPIAHLCIVHYSRGRNETPRCPKTRNYTLPPSAFNAQLISSQIYGSLFLFLFAIFSPNVRARHDARIKTKPNSSSSLCCVLGTVAALGDVSVCFKVRTRTLQQDHASRFRHKQCHFVLCQSQTVTWKTGLFLPQTELTFWLIYGYMTWGIVCVEQTQPFQAETLSLAGWIALWQRNIARIVSIAGLSLHVHVVTL